MSEIIYCANGCTRRHGDQWDRVTTEPPSLICTQCEDRIKNWLTKIPNLYTDLALFIEHGVVEKNPDSKSTRSAIAQAPMRLEIIDLLDTRRGRHWNGLTPTNDRRGVAGWLKVHIDNLIEERPLTKVDPITTIAAACKFLDRHLLWIAEQPWVTYLYDDLRHLHRNLSDAIGDYRRPPVGTCHTLNDDDDATCGGGLYANPYGGVRCARCSTTWDAAHLRQLGLAQAGVGAESA